MISSAALMREIRNLVRPLATPKVPNRISERFKDIDKKGMDVIEASLKRNYFTQEEAWFDSTYLSTYEGQEDLQNHLYGRLYNFRNTVIPWLSDAKPLHGAHILEIGCGTGCSTVALAEQGAKVIAIDVSETSLNVARDRCKLYDLNVKFYNANATEVHNVFSDQHFDFIIFSAALEHMTHNERMVAMKNTWDMLCPGGLWCVIETPNRLWYYDIHTSLLPFYQWLPEDLAFLYSQFSPRKNFCSLFREINIDKKLDFSRWGSGVSFHEFELTMKPAKELYVVSSLPIFLRKKNFLRWTLWKMMTESRYESFLVHVGPKIHRGFYQQTLDLIIRKD
jgi:S-adenosylmethionine-dependent methyltransferase